MLIDSHCHLDFTDLAKDRAGVLDRARAAGVTGMVTISTHVGRFETYRQIAETHPEIWFSVGTHPHHADEEPDVMPEDLVRLSQHPRCVAIGEAGLDYFYDNAPKAAQETGLLRHIAAARETGLPLVIHARAADERMAEILTVETARGAFPFLLHCFTGGMALARTALELGGSISFSGIVTFKNAEEIRAVAAMVPSDRYLVETDAPYLAPIPHRGATNEPSFVAHTAARLAEVRGIALEQVAAETTANFFRLFSKARAA